MMRQGQVMLLTVLTLGGTLLGITTIAGLLMIYQVRQGTDLSKSAKAIFAADSGIEWSLYNVICSANDTSSQPCPISPTPPAFTNGATVAVTCKDDTGAVIADCNSPNVATVRSIGTYSQVSRAFCIFQGCDATSSLPSGP
jgi:hypothetical protein